MSMEQRKIDVVLFRILFLLAAGIVVVQPLGFSGLTSYMFLLTFPLTVFLWIRSVRKTLTGTDLLVISVVALAALNVLINASVTGVMPGFSYIKKLIMFVVTLLFLQMAYRVRVDKNMIRFVNIVVDFLTVYFILMYFTQNVRMFTLNGRVSAYLTFCFSNPNLTGLFLTCLYMLELYRLFSPEKWYWKVIHIIMACFLAFFVWQTDSRNCLLVMTLFTGICAWLVFRGHRQMRIGKLWAAIISAFPMLFLVAYMAFVYTPWVQNTFDFLVGEGKNLDSRMRIWGPAMNQLAASPLIGAYSQISKGTGMSQMHNTHLDVACSYGIPVLILFCVLIWNYLNQKDRCYTEKASFIYILGFACAIMLGIGEAALVSGGLGLYIFIGTFLILANHTREESDSKL